MSPGSITGPVKTHSATPLRRLRAGIIAFSLTLIVGYGLDTYRHVNAERQEILKDALEKAEILVLTLDEHLARTVQAAGLVLDTAVQRVEQALREPAVDMAGLGSAFQDLQGRAPQLVNLGLIDIRGRVAIDTFSAALGVDLSTREYFRTHSREPSTAILLSPTVSSRVTGRLFVPLSRRVDHPDGSFAGVVYGGLEPEYLENFYSRLQGRSVVTLSVYSADGIRIARIPRRAGAMGQDMSQSPLFTTLLLQAQAGIARLAADEDSPDRYVAFRHSADMPYVITAAIAESVILASWERQAADTILQTALVFAAVIGLTALLVAMTYRRERIQADLLVSEARYRHFTEATSDWFWEMDAELRFTHFSGRFEEVFGVPSSILLGRRRQDMANPGETPAAWQQHLDDLRARRPFRDFTYKPDMGTGRDIYCRLSGQPVFADDGTFLGYRGTGRDVTAEVLADRRANQARELLSNALEKIAEGFVLYDADDRLVMWNSQYAKIHAHTADLMVRGRRFADIIREAAARGSVADANGRVEEWVAERIAAHQQPHGVHEQKFADGRWLRIQETQLPDGGRVGIHTDITETKAREAELRDLAQKNELFAVAIATTTSGIIITDPTLHNHPIVYVNPAFTSLTGYSADEAIGRSTHFLRAPQADPQAVQAIEGAWQQERPGGARILNRRRDGSTFYADIRVSPVRDLTQRVTHFIGVLNDVTPQVLAEEGLRESEERMRSIAENLPGLTLQRVQKPDGSIHYTYISERTVEISGFAPQEYFADANLIWKIVDPRDAPAYRAALEQSARNLTTADVNYRIKRRDGAQRRLHGMFRPRRAANGDIIWDGLVFDVTERVEAEEKLRESEARLRGIAGNLPGVVYQRISSRDGTYRYAYVSERCVELSGYTAEEWMADATIIRNALVPETLPAFDAAVRQAATEMKPGSIEFQIITKAGERRWWHSMFSPRRLANGDLLWDGVVFDVTNRVKAEETIRESEARLRSIAENLPGVVYQRVMRQDGTVTYPYVSMRAIELTGYSDREIVNDPTLLPRIIAPEFHASYAEVIKRSAVEMARAQFEFRLVRRDGEERWARGLCQPRRLPNGDILWDGLIFDITEQKRTEQQRIELEAQLRHAQKIEAVGTLAGGIAHDINNTLVPIVALGKMTLQALPADSPERDNMQTILDAAYRVRDLVAEILAFSRKEMPRTQPTQLQDIVTKAVRLLSASLAPNISIVQEIADIGPIEADENQLVQVVMNLCTNSAHAIGSRNGRITIGLDAVGIKETTGGLAPGGYARLVVADNGNGMDSLTLQRIFEPFFTTKGVGEGTGLGLAVVHGIIANHRGRISAESEPGRGTTFTILLPLAESNEMTGIAAEQPLTAA